jgi:hypothetical protein
VPAPFSGYDLDGSGKQKNEQGKHPIKSVKYKTVISVTVWSTCHEHRVRDWRKGEEKLPKNVGIPLALCPDAGGLNIYGREP